MKVAVIIPYVKDRGFLDRAVRSIEHQSYSGNGDILLVYSKSDHFVGVNLNRGIEVALASGCDLIRYLCDDDELTPNSIADTVKYFQENPEVDFIHGNTEHIDDSSRFLAKYKPTSEVFGYRDLLAKNHIHGGTTVYHRRVFEKFGTFDETLWTGEELDFHLKILKAGARIGYLDRTLYRYRRHPHQKSTGKRSPLKFAERVEAIKAIRRRYR